MAHIVRIPLKDNSFGWYDQERAVIEQRLAHVRAQAITPEREVEYRSLIERRAALHDAMTSCRNYDYGI